MSASSFFIQLSDGQLFPVPATQSVAAPTAFRLYTSMPQQRSLELIVWEDTPGKPSPREFVGTAVIALPPQLAQYTALDVTFHPSTEGSVAVTVTVTGNPASMQEVLLRRRAWGTDRLNQLMQASGRLNDLAQRWRSELTDNERRNSIELRNKISEALAGKPIDDNGLDRLIYAGETMARQLEIVRSRDTLISSLLGYGGKYLTPGQQQQLLQIHAAIKEARQRGDGLRALAVIEEHDRDIDALGEPLLVLVHALAALQSQRLPTPVANTLQAAVRDVEQGMSQTNSQQISRGLTQLMHSLDSTITALQEQHKTLSVVGRPVDVIP